MNNSISLRPLRTDDAEWIFDACQDLEIQKWTQIPRPYTRQHAADFVTTLAGDVEVWVVETSDDEMLETADAVRRSTPIGIIGVHSIDPISRTAEIGYWMSRQGRGKGSMKSALQIFSAKIASNPNVSNISAIIAEANYASRRTVESVGFVLDSDSDQSCNCGGQDVKAVTYIWTIKPQQSLLAL